MNPRIRRLIVMPLLTLSFLHGGEITDDDGFKALYAPKENRSKTLVMMYSAKSCPQCAYMKQKVFQDPEVKAYMERHFVVLEKDINYDDLPEGFDYFGIPTMFFIDQNGRQIAKVIGSSRAESFLKTLKNIRNKNR
jgi:thioredoxin-related protein